MIPIPTITIQFEYSAWALVRCFIQLIAAGSIFLCILMSFTSNVLLGLFSAFPTVSALCLTLLLSTVIGEGM